MRGLRSTILRTLQSNHINLLSPNAAPSPPLPACRIQKMGPEAEEEEAEPEQPTVSDGGGGEGTDAEKENVSPGVTPRKAKKMRTSSDQQERRDLEAPSYRRPDPASATLFDPDLLVAFRHAVAAYNRVFEAAKRRDVPAISEDNGDDEPDEEDGVEHLARFESRCPPGGGGAVVLYTTTLRGVRKTFEDCGRARLLLESLRVAFLERDVSMHSSYRDELWSLLGWKAVPPRLFIEGKYVGGADEVLALHEQARLQPMLRRAPRAAAEACAACGGARFVVCGACSGSHRLYDAGGSGGRVPCPGCNENGLVPCPLCS